jgi:hypothetical protein
MTEQRNIIERAWAVYEEHQRKRGVPTDEVSFVGGFASCYGILTGRVNVGLPEDTPVLKVFELVQRELEQFRSNVIRGE